MVKTVSPMAKKARPKVKIKEIMVSVSKRVGGGSVPVRVWVQVEVFFLVWVRAQVQAGAYVWVHEWVHRLALVCLYLQAPQELTALLRCLHRYCRY